MSHFDEKGNVEDRSKLSQLIGRKITRIQMTDRGYIKIETRRRFNGPVQSFEMPYDYLFDTDGNRFEDDVS